MNPDEKGRALERAVHAIESAILQTAPGLAEAKITISPRRTFCVDGVHHEIDLWVEVDHGANYAALFLFECKNWRSPVGKNEVVVLSEKIRAAAAQAGYLVAQSFTADARAQAAKDPRVTLLEASQVPEPDLALPFGYHVLHNDILRTDVASVSVESNSAEFSPELEEAVRFDGAQVTLRQAVAALAKRAVHEDTSGFRSDTLPEGEYDRAVTRSFLFADDQLKFERHDAWVRSIELTVQYRARVLRPRVVSSFDVATRGRSFEFEAVDLGSHGSVATNIVEQATR